VYNDALLKQAKLEVPKTTDEFYRALKALRDPAKQQFGYATFSKPGAANVFYIEISPIAIGMGGRVLPGREAAGHRPGDGRRI